VIASPTRIDTLREGFPWNRISSTLHKVLSTTLSNRDALAMRLKTFADEALRLAGALNKLGVQSRISATDFVLIRVADPARVTNNLSLAQIHTDNLSGVPGLENYIRYRLQSVNANTALLRAFERMPSEYYKTTGLDRRIVRLTRTKEYRPTKATDRFSTVREAGGRLAGDRK
jgi:histidinol-phosphate/aromatic aminotransferase/cobyric acid decarboxylase-like protein